MGLLVLGMVMMILSHRPVAAASERLGRSVFSSLQLALHEVGAFFGGSWNTIAELRRMRAALEDARRRLLELEQLSSDMGELERQNAELRRQLGFAAPPTFRHLPAEVMARAPGNLFTNLTINRGTGDGIRADLVPGEGDRVRRRDQCPRFDLDSARILADAWSYDDLRRESRLDESGQEIRRELSRGQRDRFRSRHHGLFLLQVAFEARVLRDWTGSVQESARRSIARHGRLFLGACCRNIHQCVLTGLGSNALRTGIDINRRDVASSGCATKGTEGPVWGHHSDEV